MEPSLYEGDVVLVARPRRSPRRGRVAVIRMPADAGPQWQVKRIVGLPGDRVALEDGMLFINGAHHIEPYLRGLPGHIGMNRLEFFITDGEYFILGDNRSRSIDSRSFGAINGERIAGLVIRRIWPPVRYSYAGRVQS